MLRTEFGEKLVLIKASQALTKDVDENTDLSQPTTFWKLSGIERVNIYQSEITENATACLTRGKNYNGYYLDGALHFLDEGKEYLVEIFFLGKEKLKVYATSKFLGMLQQIRQLNERAVITDQIHPKLKEKALNLKSVNHKSNLIPLMVFCIGLFLLLSFFATLILEVIEVSMPFKLQVATESTGFLFGFIAIFIGFKMISSPKKTSTR